MEWFFMVLSPFLKYGFIIGVIPVIVKPIFLDNLAGSIPLCA